MTKREIVNSLLPDEIKIDVLDAKGSNSEFDKCLESKGIFINTIVSIKLIYKSEQVWVNLFCGANMITDDTELVFSDHPLHKEPYLDVKHRIDTAYKTTKSRELDELFNAFDTHVFNNRGFSLHERQPDALWIVADVLEKEESFKFESFSISKAGKPTDIEIRRLLQIEDMLLDAKSYFAESFQ